TSDAEYSATLEREQNLACGTPEHEKALGEFTARMAKYRKDKLYPLLPQWEVFCFYPMSKRRIVEQNWYALPFEERKKLMVAHAPVVVAYSGGVDSAYLLAQAHRFLGDDLLGVIADSPSLPRQALADALALAAQIGVRVEVMRTEELANPEYVANPLNRCYFC